MNIIETTLKFGSMNSRRITRRIILHHAAAKECSAYDIDRWHKQRGWSGAGYHFLVRKDGTIYRLRPEKYVGAHASGNNSDSIGICFEGNFDTERMSMSQINSGRELVVYIKEKYGISKIQCHKDVGSTSCPGANFPFSQIVDGVPLEPPVGTMAEPCGTIVVDGWWGVNTTRLLQRVFETTVDGIVSNQDGKQKKYLLRADPTSWDFKGNGNGSNLIGAMQRHVGVEDDGFVGPNTIKAWQRLLGVKADGYMGVVTVKALQVWVNNKVV